MKFEFDSKASFVINATLGTMEIGKRMMVYTCREAGWQFMINYDEMHDQWTATYQEREIVEGKRYSAIPCELPLAITGKKFRYYTTREEAEAAAQRKLNQLNN
jgi:hypothetical protein